MRNSSVTNNEPMGLISTRNILFLLFNVLTLVAYCPFLIKLYSLPLSSADTYSYLLMIPVITAYFIYSERKLIFSDIKYSALSGSIFILAGIVIYFTGKFYQNVLNNNDYLSVLTLSAIVFWFGGFVFFYGLQAFKNMKFPFLFLVFMIPIPSVIIDNLVSFFQKYSAEAAYGLFNMLGVSFVREGMTFHFSKVSVEVAPQCSGIRSSIALFITSIIAGHLFLKTTSRKTVLSLAIIPVTILKNGIRIVTITLLAIYVDMSFLTSGWLHKQGGIVFFAMALILLLPVLLVLRKSEKKVFEKL